MTPETPPAPPVPIPPGNPLEASRLIAARAVPTGPAIQTALSQITIDLDAAIEGCRLHPAEQMHGLRPFILRVAGLLERRASLTAKSQGIELEQPSDVAPETHAIVRSIARWADGEALRDVRIQLIERLQSELDASRRLTQTAIVNPGRSSTQTPIAQEAALQARLQDLLESARETQERLTALDGGDANRAVELAPTINAQKGVDELSKRLWPLLPTLDDRGHVAATAADIASAQAQLNAVDPATHRAAALRATLERLQGMAKHLQDLDSADRQARAKGLLAAAASGQLGALAALAPFAARIGDALAQAVALARGTDADLVLVIRELITADHTHRAKLAGAKDALRKRMTGR
jgi:hypothetical protein